MRVFKRKIGGKKIKKIERLVATWKIREEGQKGISICRGEKIIVYYVDRLKDQKTHGSIGEINDFARDFVDDVAIALASDGALVEGHDVLS